MDGEPHLGKQIEMTVEVSRDEYIEGIVTALLEGYDDISDTFEISDGDYIQEYSLGDYLSSSELESIVAELNEQVIGSDKESSLLYELVDAFIPDDWEDEFEIVKMRGY
jgi:hypothetical protein